MTTFAGRDITLRSSHVLESVAARLFDDEIPDWAAPPGRLTVDLELQYKDSAQVATALARVAATDKKGIWAVQVLVAVRFDLAVDFPFDEVGPEQQKVELLRLTWTDVRAALRAAGHSIDVGVATPAEPPKDVAAATIR